MDLNKLCIHTITCKPLPLEEACEAFANIGATGISIWRDAVENMAPSVVRACLKRNGLSPVSYVRGGFFPSLEAEKRKAAIADNIKMLEEASEMEIPMLVLVCGAEHGQSLQVSR